MKGIPKIKWFFLLLGALLIAGGACAQEIRFWAAPNPPQTQFWRDMAQAYAKVKPDVKITVTAIPESPSSEAAILASIAGGTAPTVSENIFVGFGAQLHDAKAIVSLDTLPGWNDLISARDMQTAIKGWTFPDGHAYIFPIYTNAMLMGWRSDILKEIGISKPPRTYSEVLAACTALKKKYPDKYLLADANVVNDTWWQRWFDFFELYDAASAGHSFVSGDKVTADDQAVIGVFNFYQQLMKNKCILTQTVQDPFVKGISIWASLGPWTYPDWDKRFPDFKMGSNFVLTPPPVPDTYPADKPIYTFADAKGIVIYSQASKAQQQAAWDFVKWVFSKPENDLTWFKVTNLPPVRGNLTSNATFEAFFKQHPLLKPYADEIPYAVPPPMSSKSQDLQTTLGDAGFIPAVKGQKTPEQAWQDAKKAIEALLK